MRRVLFLVGGSLLFWLLASLPFRILADDRDAGDAAVVYAGTAILLCLLPTSLTLLWSSYALKQAPEQQLTAVLGGTGLRVFGVLLMGFALFQWVPYFRKYPGFWTWLLVSYLVTLALEMTLLLAGRPDPMASGGCEPPGPSTHRGVHTPRSPTE
ncbi:MAG: hypothetical protein HYS12_24695 [Planctomycetes bacterium]|nr:hypothetical protein [Planctomycetota bacterium]